MVEVVLVVVVVVVDVDVEVVGSVLQAVIKKNMIQSEINQL